MSVPEEDRKGLYVKGPVPEKRAAQNLLNAHNRQLKGYVIACLRALLADPDGELERLRPHWPEEKHPGRPPKARDT